MSRKDYAGRKYGRLTVVKTCTPYCMCVCDCGSSVKVKTNNLTSGNTKSCGCLPFEKMKSEMEGKKYGRLTVVSLERGGETRAHCICDCGKTHTTSASSVKIGTTRSCGCLQRESASLTGPDHWNWKRGYSVNKAGYADLSQGKYHGTERLAHREVMSRYIGRKLESTESVHHRNKDKLDNRLENLIMFKGGEPEHHKHHAEVRASLGWLSNKRILCTGGAGFLGKNFVRYILANSNVGRVIVFSRDDSKHEAMRNSMKEFEGRVDYYIGDIRDRDRLNMALNNIDYVAHFAALKIVPSIELDPREAVCTNIIGSQNLLEACLQAHVERAVCVSTDKASGVIKNAYGISKAMMEKEFIAFNAYNKNGTPSFTSARFGNVASSTSSVIPLWKDRSRRGSISVTDPDMTRFYMTVFDAINLVLAAFRCGSGNIVVGKHKAYRLGDLADAFHDLTGCVVESIGARPGERKHEILADVEEASRGIDRGTHLEITASYVSERDELSSDTAERMDKEELKRILSSDIEWTQDLTS